MANEFKPITTQEEFDELLKTRLEREKVKQDKLNEELTTLKSEYDTFKGEVEALKPELAELPVLRREKLVGEVARTLGVPERLVPRLRGDTKEQIEADAKILMADLAAMGKSGIPATPGTSGEPKLEGKDLIHNFAGKQFAK